ncbi:MAG: GNAT family N-acetyltransferase [Nitrospirae bacterium]|nr:GNAT family N-acetyltransferase [Nitrospirota bacterium]
MEIRAVSTLKGLSELEEHWKKIFRESGSSNVFLSWEWSFLWAKHFVRDGGLMILTAEENGSIIGIAPLMRSCRVNRMSHSFLGGELADYADFLIIGSRKDALRAFLDFIFANKDWGVISLKRIPQSSPNLPLIREIIAEADYPSSLEAVSESPGVKIDETWEAYYKGRSKGLRQDIRTAHNKFNLLGGAALEVFGRAGSDEFLQAFFEMHRERQSEKLGESIFDKQEYRDFFTELAAVFHDAGLLDFSVLKVRGKIISAVFAIKCNGVFFYWVPAFDSGYIKYSPGKVHLEMLLEKCFDSGYKEFDLMRGGEDYKYKWANESSGNYELRIYRGKLSFFLGAARESARNRLKIIYNKNSFIRRLLIAASKIRTS